MDYSWNTYQYHAKQYKSWQLFKYLNQIKGTWVRLRSKRRKRQEFSFFISEHVIVLPYGISPPRTGNSITNFFSITQHIEHKLRNASFYFLPIPWLQSGLNEGVIIWLKVWEEGCGPIPGDQVILAPWIIVLQIVADTNKIDIKHQWFNSNLESTRRGEAP